jgi:hypothetical protein
MSDEHRDFETQPMYYIGFCPTCGTGPLGLRTCGSCGAVVVVCDECDSAWPDSDVSATPATRGAETLPCPHCEADLYSEPAHWSTLEEIEAAEWVDSASRADRIVLKSNRPATDDDTDDASTA